MNSLNHRIQTELLAVNSLQGGGGLYMWKRGGWQCDNIRPKQDFTFKFRLGCPPPLLAHQGSYPCTETCHTCVRAFKHVRRIRQWRHSDMSWWFLLLSAFKTHTSFSIFIFLSLNRIFCCLSHVKMMFETCISHLFTQNRKRLSTTSSVKREPITVKVSWPR